MYCNSFGTSPCIFGYFHNSTSSSSRFLEQQQFFEPTAIPRQSSTSPFSTHKAPGQQSRPQPTPAAVHPRTTVLAQRIRAQTPTEPLLHSANDNDKSHSTDLPDYYQLKGTHGPSTVTYNMEDLFLATHDPIYRQIGR